MMACEIDSPGVAALDKFHPGQSLLPGRLHLLFEIGTSPDRCRHVPLAAHAPKRACRVRVGHIVRWLDPRRRLAITNHQHFILQQYFKEGDKSPDHIHRHAQLLGDNLGHFCVHPLTHLDPSVGNGHTSVVVVDGNVDGVPGVVSRHVSLQRTHLVPNWL